VPACQEFCRKRHLKHGESAGNSFQKNTEGPHLLRRAFKPTFLKFCFLAGPSFPIKRSLEPASYANGLFRPALYASAHAPPLHDREHSRQSAPPAKQQMTAPRAMHAVAHEDAKDLNRAVNLGRVD